MAECCIVVRYAFADERKPIMGTLSLALISLPLPMILWTMATGKPLAKKIDPAIAYFIAFIVSFSAMLAIVDIPVAFTPLGNYLFFVYTCLFITQPLYLLCVILNNRKYPKTQTSNNEISSEDPIQPINES